jgi:hypothetical protein
MPSADKDQKSDKLDRERKLAQALRANLRRRKGSGRAPPAEPKVGKSGNEG